jgi:hypothetical protein
VDNRKSSNDPPQIPHPFDVDSLTETIIEAQPLFLTEAVAGKNERQTH